jgi:chromosome segregation ATPase
MNELRKQTVSIPRRVTEVEAKLRTAQTKLDEMVNAKPIKEVYDKLKQGGELSSLKSQLAVYDKDTLPKMRAEQKECDEQLKLVETRRKLAEQLQNEIVIIDKYASECGDIERKIDAVIRNNSQLSEDEDSGVDIDDLSVQKAALQTEATQLAQAVRAKQDEVTKHYKRTDHVNSLKERLNEMKTKRNELTMRSQKKAQLGEKKLELEAEIKSAEASMAELNAELKVSIQSLSKLVSDRQANQAVGQASLAERSKFHAELRDLMSRVREHAQFVEKFESGNEIGQRKNLKRDLKELEECEREGSAEIEKLREKLDGIKSELARHEIKQRELNDNLKLDFYTKFNKSMIDVVI